MNQKFLTALYACRTSMRWKYLESASYCIALKPPPVFLASKSLVDFHFKLQGKPLNTVLYTKGFKEWPVVKDSPNKTINATGKKKERKKKETSEVLS